MDILTPSGGTIFWTVVNFVILLLVLKRLAWRPLVSALDEREKRIRESLEKAEQTQKEAEEKLAEYHAMLEGAKKESQEILARSKKTAETMREELIAKAKSEADSLLDRAKKEIDLERDKALDEIKRLAVDLSLAATKKVIGKALSQKDHEELIGQALKEMGEIN